HWRAAVPLTPRLGAAVRPAATDAAGRRGGKGEGLEHSLGNHHPPAYGHTMVEWRAPESRLGDRRAASAGQPAVKPERQDYPLTPPARHPWMRYRWTATKKAIVGTVMTTPAAMIIPQSTMVALKRSLTPTGSVFSSSEVMRTRAKRKSFQARMKVKMPAAMMPGRARGRTTYHTARPRPAPSTRAAASSSRGMLWKNERRSQRQKGRQKVV